MDTVTIRAEQLRRWKAGEPRGISQVLFESGLWQWMLQDIPATRIDATEDAMLVVEGELRRREQDFTPESFVEAFRAQTFRRARDIRIKAGQRDAETFSLDEPWISGGEDAETGTAAKLDQVASTEAAGQPGRAWRATEVERLTRRLLVRFGQTLTGAQERHFGTLRDGVAELHPHEGAVEREAHLYEFLHVENAHRDELVGYVIAHCCGNRNTAYTHTRRLRQAWHGFIAAAGVGHADYGQLVEIMQGSG